MKIDCVPSQDPEDFHVFENRGGGRGGLCVFGSRGGSTVCSVNIGIDINGTEQDICSKVTVVQDVGT